MQEFTLELQRRRKKIGREQPVIELQLWPQEQLTGRGMRWPPMEWMTQTSGTRTTREMNLNHPKSATWSQSATVEDISDLTDAGSMRRRSLQGDQTVQPGSMTSIPNLKRSQWPQGKTIWQTWQTGWTGWRMSLRFDRSWTKSSWMLMRPSTMRRSRWSPKKMRRLKVLTMKSSKTAQRTMRSLTGKHTLVRSCRSRCCMSPPRPCPRKDIPMWSASLVERQRTQCLWEAFGST